MTKPDLGISEYGTMHGKGGFLLSIVEAIIQLVLDPKS